MDKHYTFQHTCGHTGIGPVICAPSDQGEVYHRPTASNTTPLLLPFQCPFCTNNLPYLNVAPGDGLLAILESTQNNPFPYEWRILRVCRAHEILPGDWYLAHGPGGRYRQMAWIPRPCGAVRAIDGLEEVRRREGILSGMAMQIDCSWWQPFGEPTRSRLAGMLSELNACLFSDEGDGRG
jgi:hypothetical protein